MAYTGLQLTDTVMMVKPIDFTFNEQTAADNEFQHKLADSSTNVTELVLEEFNNAVSLLKNHGINVLVLDYAASVTKTPDAVFPNNWISMHRSGTVFLYPMFAPNRRLETERYPDVQRLMLQNGKMILETKDLRSAAVDGHYLEGTGSVIFDHTNKIIYASLSVRTNVEALAELKDSLDYERVIVFKSASSSGKEFYHTNVILSIGDKHAIICAEAIPDKEERSWVVESLAKTHDVITITLEQTEKHFCGNSLQLVNSSGEKFIVMSENALNAFTDDQKEQLKPHGTLLGLSIPTIEYIGGGSARCMIAEVFLPKA
jgi:hypothetical protein